MRVAFAAAAVLFGAVEASVTVGNKVYATADYFFGGNINQRVQAAYSQDHRPVQSSEWPAIRAAAGPNMVSSLGPNEFAFWDESNFQWVKINPSFPDADPVPIGDPRNTGIFLLTNTNAARSCPSDKSSPVNIVDTYPNTGLSLTDNIVDSCLCYSQFSGDLCDSYTTATGCPNATVVAMTANTGQQIIKDGINGGTINPLAETVEFQIDSPQVTTRNYSYFEWGSCKSGAANTNDILRKFEVATAQNNCNDGWRFGYLVSGLRNVCGLQQAYRMYDGSREGVANASWVRYRGDLNMYYTEIVTLSLNNGAYTEQLNRTGRLVTPIDVYILRLYAAELNTTTSINVFSPFQLKAAITATNVKANQTTATVDITFGISNPYEIKFISNEYPGDGGSTIPGVKWVSNNVPDIAAAYLVDKTGAVVPTATVTQGSNAGLLACNATDYDANGFCWRTVRVLIVTDTACTLDHTFTFNTIAIGCNGQYSGNDCPLTSFDTSSQASFTVRAADYCDGQRALVILGAIVIKAYVPQRVMSRTSLNMMRSYALNEDAWLTLFIDAEKSLKVYNMDAIQFETRLANGTYTIPPDAASYLIAVNSKAPGWSGVAQGFDVATLSHTMAVTLDCNFVVDVSGTCLVAPGNGGPFSLEVFARLTFYVDYEPASGIGRRRRQAVNSERGYASIDAQSTVTSSQTEAEAQPSSASGVSASTSLVAMATAAMFSMLL